MKIKITDKEIREYLDIETTEFPKYISPLINLANRFAQGTRPRIVGQMTELIHQFTGKKVSEWEQWYLKQKPEAIKNATEMVLKKIDNFKDALNRIDKSLVEKWIRDLIIVKTFIGLRFHEAVLKKGAAINKTSYRLADSEDESKGIDGYIGNTPISIKPNTYLLKPDLIENIKAKIIYYKKIEGGIEVDYSNILKS
jgi:ribosomal protein S19